MKTAEEIENKNRKRNCIGNGRLQKQDKLKRFNKVERRKNYERIIFERNRKSGSKGKED